MVANSRKPEIPALEWICAAVGAIIVTAALIYFVVDATRVETPPDLVARAVAVRAATAGWVVQIDVENRGDATAAQVNVMGTLPNGEERVVSFDFVPGRSRRHASIVFATRPDGGLDVRVVSFREP